MPKPPRCQRRRAPHVRTSDACLPCRVEALACHHVGHWASRGSTAPFKLSQSPPQCLLLLPALGVITHNGSNAREVSVRGVEQGDSEGNGEALAIFTQRRDPQDVSMVTRLTCPHNGVIPLPVPLPEALRDNQVERVAHDFGGRETKETLSGRIP